MTVLATKMFKDWISFFLYCDHESVDQNYQPFYSVKMLSKYFKSLLFEF